MSERAEGLRKRVATEVRLAQSDSVMGGRDTHAYYTARVLRAAVDELGVRPGMVGHLHPDCCTCDDIGNALSTLLEAAGDR